MVKLPRRFSVGDRVFAKVRGYPPWPARIESVSEPNTKAPKYNVIFYGTRETGVCKFEDLFHYLENKEKFSKAQKRKLFRDGLLELEEDLKNNPGPVTEAADREVTENVPEYVEKRNSAVSSPADNDEESGNLVIDEGDKKKGVKRKLSQVVNTPDVPEVKKKRGRKSVTAILAESTPKQDSAQDSQDEDSERKVVSRSGRKIKPKRFHDYADVETSIDATRIDQPTRNRTKSKSEDTNENQESSVALVKKRISAENDEKKGSVQVAVVTPEVQQPVRSAKDDAVDKENALKVKTLRIESQIIFLDTQIRSSLGLDQANADECLEAMDQLMDLQINQLILKKHSHIIETIKRLRRYVGNLNDWKLTEQETIVFKQKADLIKKKAELIYEKFKKQFTIPEGKTFWEAFVAELDVFKKHTQHLTHEEFYSLLVDPTLTPKSTKDTTTVDAALLSILASDEPVASTSNQDLSMIETEAK
ncbi:PC4 and SFRS1-interacting protein [Copidosoma floridanum]|uniref:PC4 and SFRS1-interacting protein n=1 Tax=Copidosoma floridanum TaxID=29053 RepID=UPI0006C9BEE7|nr:PC4 and SFRS1-interacting protein [Copidosoma floridanum]